MEKSHLIFEFSPWFILLCLLVGALYTYVVYQKGGPWSRKVKYLLAGLRFTLVSLLCFLLIGPIIKQINNSVEPPNVVIAIDNSQSISEVVDSSKISTYLQAAIRLGEALKTNGYGVEYRSLDSLHSADEVGNISFQQHDTPLNQLLQQVQSDYEGRNLSSLVLVSDGIYNKGLSPEYAPYNYKIHTIGLGDTLPQQDINLKALYFNKIAYQGNQFIIKAEIQNHGFVGQRTQVEISRKEAILASKTLSLSRENAVQELTFTLDADQKGLQDYVVEVKPIIGEFSDNNNIRHAYVDIIEGRKKILLAALAPHPDIKAIKNAIEQNQNYELVRFIPGIDSWQQEDYDLIISHQLANWQAPAMAPIKTLLSSTSVWFILGNQSNLNLFNQSNQILQISAPNGQRDQVTPLLNPNFTKFTLPEEANRLLDQVTPITVPFGTYNLSGAAEVLLYQKVGNVTTEKPLIAVVDEGEMKRAVLVGEGIWQWRLQEGYNEESTLMFDQLIGKLIQYLATKTDKSKFKAYPIKNEFDISEPVVIEAEVYNDIFERIYGHQIDLEIIPESGARSKFTFVTSEGSSQYRINGLPQGIYRYQATTSINGKSETTSGQFTIQALQLETIDLTANHRLLKTISTKSGGQFFNDQQWTDLSSTLLEQEAQGLIYSDEAFVPIIKIPWAFFLVLLLAGTEWILRKYHGSY